MAQHDSSSGVSPPTAAEPATADLAARGRAAQQRDEQGVRARAAQRPRPRRRIGLTVLALVLVLTGWATLWLSLRARQTPSEPTTTSVVTVPAPPATPDLAACDASLQTASALADRRRNLQLITASRLARMQGDPTAALLLLLEVSDRTTPGWWNDMLQVAQLPIRESEVRVSEHDEVQVAAFSPDGAQIATAARFEPAQLRSADGAGHPVRLRAPDSGSAWTVAVDYGANQHRVLVADDSGDARVWQLDGDVGPWVLHTFEHETPIVRAHLGLDGASVLTADLEGHAWVWSFEHPYDPVRLRGPGTQISATAFFGRNGPIVTGYADGSVRLWHPGTTRPLTELPGHRPGHRIVTAALSHNLDHALTADEEGVVRVWNTRSGELCMELRGHRGFLRSAQFSPSGNHILTAASDGTAALWSLDNPKVPQVLYGDVHALQTALISPDEQLILTIDVQGGMQLWDRANLARPIAVLATQGPIVNARFSGDSQRFTVVLASGMAHTWRLPRNLFHLALPRGTTSPLRTAVTLREPAPQLPRVKRLLVAGQHGDSSPDHRLSCSTPHSLIAQSGAMAHAFGTIHAADLAFFPDGRRFITSTIFGVAHLWDLDSDEPPVALSAHTDDVTSVVWSADGEHVATTSADGTARIWLARPPYSSWAIPGSPFSPFSVRFSPDGSSVLTPSGDGDLLLWPVDGSTPGRRVARDVAVGTFSDDGRLIFTSHYNNEIRIWATDGDGRTPLDQIDVGSQGAATWESPDGVYMVLDSPAARPYVRRLNGDGPFILPNLPNSVERRFSPDEEWVAVTSGFEVGRGLERRCLREGGAPCGHPSSATSCRYAAPNFENLPTAVYLVSTRCTSPSVVLTGARDLVRSITFSPDNGYVAGIDDNEELIIWDRTQPQAPLVRLRVPGLRHVEFSPDHQHLFLLSGDGTIRLMPAHPDGLFRMLRGFTELNLTGAMRARYAPD